MEVPLSISIGVSVLTAIGGGCAIDGVGFPSVRVERYENDSGSVVTLVAWGLHLSTHELDSGLTLGHTRKTYVYQNHDASTIAPGQVAELMALLNEEPASAAALHRRSEGCRGHDDRDRAIAFASESSGLMVYTGGARVGFGLGFNTHAALRVPLEFDGVIVLSLDPRDVGASELLVKEISR